MQKQLTCRNHLPLPVSAFFLLAYFPWIPFGAYAALVNITVDDANTAIQYAPFDIWRSFHPANIPAASPYNGTLHAAFATAIAASHSLNLVSAGGHAQLPSAMTAATATLRFTGSALYVYCIIASPPSSPSNTSASPSASAPEAAAAPTPAHTDLLFVLDGKDVGTFSLPAAPPLSSTLPRLPSRFQSDSDIVPSSCSPPPRLRSPRRGDDYSCGLDGYKFKNDILVYSTVSLPPGPHTFELRSVVSRVGERVALLDYMIYTINTTVPPSHRVSGYRSHAFGYASPSSPAGYGATTTSSSSSSHIATPSSSSSSSSVPMPVSPLPPSPRPSASPSSLELSSSSSSSSTSTHARTIIIAVLCTILPTLLLLTLGFLLYRRRRLRLPPLPPLPPMPRPENILHPYVHSLSISGDPSSSGWARGTWGADSPEPHPSLTNIAEAEETAGAGRGNREQLRGDVLARDVSRTGKTRPPFAVEGVQPEGSSSPKSSPGRGAEAGSEVPPSTSPASPEAWASPPTTAGSSGELHPLLRHPYAREGSATMASQAIPENDADNEHPQGPKISTLGTDVGRDGGGRFRDAQLQLRQDTQVQSAPARRHEGSPRARVELQQQSKSQTRPRTEADSQPQSQPPSSQSAVHPPLNVQTQLPSRSRPQPRSETQGQLQSPASARSERRPLPRPPHLLLEAQADAVRARRHAFVHLEAAQSSPPPPYLHDHSDGR